MCNARVCQHCAYADDGHPYGLPAMSTPGVKHNDMVIEEPPFDSSELIVIFFSAIGLAACLFSVFFVGPYIEAAMAKAPRPNLFIRFIGVKGLEPGSSPSGPPAFLLAVDVDGVSRRYQACHGGGTSVLHVSYHGMNLAWGYVPRFCIDGDRLKQSVDGVTTVEAKAEGAVLREEVRGLVWSEQHVVGMAEFDVEGEVAGLGHLRCKTFFLDGKSTDFKVPCVVQ